MFEDYTTENLKHSLKVIEEHLRNGTAVMYYKRVATDIEEELNNRNEIKRVN